MPISLSELTWGVKNPLVFQYQSLQQTVLHVYHFQKYCSVDAHLHCRLFMPLKWESLAMDVSNSSSLHTLGINQGRRRGKYICNLATKRSLEHFNDASGSNQGCCWALERAPRSGRILLLISTTLETKAHAAHIPGRACHQICVYSAAKSGQPHIHYPPFSSVSLS